MAHGQCVTNGASGKPGEIPEYVALHWHRELCQCEHYIYPILVGKKMDTIEKEPKQGADTTADLSKQKPQEEVLKLISSTACSDEEKLAAGISTIGPQTKRISEAQKRKFLRERKMKEGTWIEKPNRNTPPSQDRGTAGNSGGVKRPHTDSSTPPKEKQQPKRPRSTQVQTGTCKEAVVGIKMAIVAPS
jgi:hypothetical protein